jgi:hypothetical protein
LAAHALCSEQRSQGIQEAAKPMNASLQPMQVLQAMTERSSVTSWLNHLRVLMPPSRVLLVGAGSANGRWVQWLQQAHIESAILVEGADESFQSIENLVSTKPNWRARKQVIGLNTEDVTFYVASIASESGLSDPEDQRGIWPNIKTRQKQARQAIALAEAMKDEEGTPDWLILDCTPALSLLKGAADFLEGVQVLMARTALPTAGKQAESQELAELTQHLGKAGFMLVCTEAGRHPALGHALFVRQARPQSENLRQQLEVALAENIRQSERSAVELAQAVAATQSLIAEQVALLGQVSAAQAQSGQLQAQLLQMKEAQQKQANAMSESKEALEKALAAEQAEMAVLSKEKTELVAVKEKLEKLANERQARIKLLDQRVQLLQGNLDSVEGKYRLLQAELVKAEAQIELIKAFVLREPAQ